MPAIRPLQRKEKPDFERFLRVIRRQGGRQYVPFFELVIDTRHFAPLAGIPPPQGLNFVPTSPTFEASFRFYLECCARMGFDHGTINLCGFRGFPAARHGIEGTVRGFIQDSDGLIRTEEDFEKYPWPSAGQIDVEAMERTARLAPEGLGVMTGNEAIFQTGMMILGFGNMAMLVYDNPGLVKAVFDRLGSILAEVYDLAASLPFIRGVIVSGDMGHKTGTFLSPQLLREWVFPWHKRMVQAIHRHGKIAILHSCGNLAAVMDDILACGYDAKHSFEDAIQPGLTELHDRYGRRICLLGGIDVDFLCRADEPALRRRIRETIDRLAPDGGYVLGSGNSIPDYVPTENYRILLDEGLKYGRP